MALPEIEAAFGRAGVALGADVGEAFSRYVALLVRWNARINLTAVRDLTGIAEAHLLDSSLVARRVLPADRVVDVGSGAGFPGLVVAVLCPTAHVTLVEPNAKKVAFLRAAASEAGARNVEVVRGRDTDLAADAWDRAVSRATLAPAQWLVAGTRLVRPGGAVGVMVAGVDALPEGGTELTRVDVDTLTLPSSGAPRTVGWYVRAGGAAITSAA